MAKFIAVEEAVQQILSNIPLASTERVQLATANGRFLAGAVEAPWNSPRFDNSAMDGYAVRWEDLDSTPVTLSITSESAAGHPSDQVVPSGHAAHISTGAAVPSGADTVVPRELCHRQGDQVTIEETPSRGQGANIRYAATYLKAGQPALGPGTRLGGAEIGLLASFGKPVVPVYSRPTVGVLSTGDELVELGDTPGPGQIVNSNAYMLEALLAEQGANPRIYPTVADSRQAVNEAFEQAISECDIVVSSGGVSVGDHDHVTAAVDELCGGMTFWKVRAKPGKPLAFGVASRGERAVPIIGLPGNPAASFVGFQLYVRPALLTFQGVDPVQATLPRVEATLEGSVRGSRNRRFYAAGNASPTGAGLSFRPRSHQSSGNPALFAGVNALGIIDEELDRLDDGASIDVHLLG